LRDSLAYQDATSLSASDARLSSHFRPPRPAAPDSENRRHGRDPHRLHPARPGGIVAVQNKHLQATRGREKVSGDEDRLTPANRLTRLLLGRPDLNHTVRLQPMTIASDITPVFVTKSDVPPRNVLPALARLLIDVDRRQKLTNDGSPMMLKELPLDPAAPWMMQQCHTQN